MQSSWDADELFANTEYVQMHLELASAKINGALAKRFTVPVEPPPLQLQYICLRIAHWSQEQLGEIREAVQAHYDAAVSDLNRLATGEDSLIATDGTVVLPVSDLTRPGD